MKRSVVSKSIAAAFALAAVVALNTTPALAQFATAGEHIGNARPNHYDVTGKQVTGWVAEETAPAAVQAPRRLYLSTRTPSSRNQKSNH